MMEYIILFKYDEDSQIYLPVQAGRGVVPNDTFDKVLPVQEHVAFQFEKLYFSDGSLKVREDFKEDFMNASEYAKYKSETESEDTFGGVGAIIKEKDTKPKIVEVEI